MSIPTSVRHVKRGVFLLGSERSGTNLLRVLLGNHSAVSAPPPIHLFDLLRPRPYLYYPYTDATRADALSRMQAIANHEFSGWELALDLDRVLAEYELESVPDLLHCLYSEKAAADGATVYFCKDNNLHHYAMGLSQRFPKARFVYIVRDPRDQVASWMKKPVHLRTPYDAAVVWQRDQETCLRLMEFFRLPIHVVRYEDLVHDTPGAMTGLLEHLDLPVEEACFQTDRSNTEAARHDLWKNINKPVMTDNTNTYRRVLSEKDVTMVETVCHREMARLGYEPVTDADAHIPNRLVRKVLGRVGGQFKPRTAGPSNLGVIQDKNAFAKQLLQADAQ